MKKYLAIIFVFLLIGCTPKAYTTSLENGKTQLDGNDFSEALKYFEKAEEEKSTEEVNLLIKASDLLNESKKALEAGEFEASVYNAKLVKDIEESKDTMGVLEVAFKKADEIAKESSEHLIQKNKIEDSITKGKTLLEQNKFDEAYATFKDANLNNSNKNKVILDLSNELNNLMKQTLEAKKAYTEKIEKERQAAEAKKKEEAARKVAEEKKKGLTEEQAKERVKQYIDLKPNPNVFVELDRVEDGNFIFQVYEIVIDDPVTQEGHTATWGWYGVNKNGIVYDAFNY
ncbi:hypothetical protein [Cytobacillus praedii]|uniref:hypothetical protein n=1 Tax=Cytobacillus praedii TaxID=1742358 RepID=UPI002E2480B9|nr:hypothetical protein [Cytobacillus praedii]